MSTDEINDASFLRASGEWAASAADRLSLSVKLAMAEARLAALSLVLMVVIGVLIAMAVAAVWALLVAIMASALINLGMTLVTVLLLLIAMHLFLIVALSIAMNRVSGSLAFRNTRRHLATSPPGTQQESSDAMVQAKA